ncbi:MAG: FtsX-like permease family protein [Deltaproteobacteria bacterium]|nr:FtsX-like permease family protein [Deltaproteobacteria bacterium]NCP02916.1 FtsX-like permease family protein [Deltaproteobacteria bacterium]
MTPSLKILDYALASLLRRKYKHLALLAVYTLTVAVLASVLFMTQSLRQEAEALLSTAPALVVQKLVGGRHDLIAEDYAAQIRTLPGVRGVEARIWGYYYDSLYGVNLTLLGRTSAQGETLELLRGQLPQQPGDCALGAGVAQTYGVEIDDSLVLVDQRNQSRIFRVSGIFSSDSQLLTQDLLVLGNADLRAFFEIPTGLAVDLAVQVYNPREIATLAAKIRQQLPATRPIARSEILHSYRTVFNWRSGMILSLLLTALLAFAILAWDRASGLGAAEKHEIGILKALGWTTSDVLQLKFWEGLCLSLTAFILGTLGGWIQVYQFGGGLLRPFFSGWSVLFPQFDLYPALSFYELASLGALTIFPYLVCTLVPAWKNAVSDPDAVMRS